MIGILKKIFSNPFFKENVYEKKSIEKYFFFQVRFSESRKYLIFLILPTCEGWEN